jgi:poly-gamma-glutamate capsule biosynthesis protein CapA/YwtB (metallophosphatase superfamily)
VTIAAVGDTILGHTPVLPPSPQTYLSAVAGDLKAPVVFGNLEGTLTDATYSKCPTPSPRKPLSGKPSPSPRQLCYAFRVPPSYAQYLRSAGFDVMNTANNHSHDFGDAGFAETQHALESAGIEPSGVLGRVAVVKARGLKVAFLGFAPYPNAPSLLDLPTARALIAHARRRADLLVVYMHAGAEGSGALHVTGNEETFAGEDRGNELSFAHMAVDAGADLVLASGPHVVRGMEFYRKHLIAYSLGDFAGYQNFGTGGTLGQSCILRVTLSSDGSFVAGTLVSLALTGQGQPVPDRSGAAAHLIAQLSGVDFGHRAARILPNGTIRPPKRS